VSNLVDMYPKLKQGTATTTTKILTRTLYGSKIKIKMDTQMEQRKFLVKSHLMNTYHLRLLGITMMQIQVEIQGEQRYAMAEIITATDK